MNTKKFFLMAVPAAAMAVVTVCAEDWPMWRGPRGDGTSLDRDVPTRWSKTDNIAWKVRIPGVGHASPIVYGTEFKLIAENPIGERCYTSPAISRGQVFLRTAKHLFCIGK